MCVQARELLLPDATTKWPVSAAFPFFLCACRNSERNYNETITPIHYTATDGIVILRVFIKSTSVAVRAAC